MGRRYPGFRDSLIRVFIGAFKNVAYEQTADDRRQRP